MIIKTSSKAVNEYSTTEFYSIYPSDSDNTIMSQAAIVTRNSIYCGSYINTVLAGGLATHPNYRRNGCIRLFFDHVFSMAPERGGSF